MGDLLPTLVGGAHRPRCCEYRPGFFICMAMIAILQFIGALIVSGLFWPIVISLTSKSNISNKPKAK
jgi:hypothetical protein